MAMVLLSARRPTPQEGRVEFSRLSSLSGLHQRSAWNSEMSTIRQSNPITAHGFDTSLSGQNEILGTQSRHSRTVRDTDC
jgi:hypothetical protein